LFKKYSQLLEEKAIIKELNYTELECTKQHSPLKDKVWSCCPKDWKPFSSHCYFTVNDLASWNESEEKCSSMGAHLMVIHSQEEQVHPGREFWHQGEPSSDNEQCVTVNHRYSGWGWNDIRCSANQ
ncbi:hypothetical protein A6R68_22076, partial [Neotoma lepida]